MESCILPKNALYSYHSGAPSDDDYCRATMCLLDRIHSDLAKHSLTLKTQEIDLNPRLLPQKPHRLVAAYGDELVLLGKKHDNLVVLDADLMVDCGLTPFKEAFPNRFVECGIAEQDMVSLAGGLALKGALPVVHSFACFLSTRPNEQIYNNATECRKVIYTGSLAGINPAGPGHSHQSVRDISTLGSIPGLTLIQPANEQETKEVLRWAIEENSESTYIRLVSIPIDLEFTLPIDYQLWKGQGTTLISGSDVLIFGYGPVLLNEAVKAARLLRDSGIHSTIINFPWLNSIDTSWLNEIIEPFKMMVVLDDHYSQLGLGTQIGNALAQMAHSPQMISLGVNEIPKCGLNQEVLQAHGLDAFNIAYTISQKLSIVKTLSMSTSK